MKNLKKTLLVLALTSLFTSYNVYAGVREDEEKKTQDQAIAELESLATENEDGTCTWNIKMVNPEILAGTYCNYTDADIIKMYSYAENLQPEEFEQLKKDVIETCKTSTYSSVIENAARKKGIANWQISVPTKFENFNPNALELKNIYDVEGQDNKAEISKTCKIEYETVSEKDLKDAEKVMKKLNQQNAIYSLTSFNSIYHYGPIFNNNRIDSDMILYKFPEFKQSLMENSQYEFDIAWSGGGGAMIDTGCEGYVMAYKDGIPVGMQYVIFKIDNRLYVDKDLPGTPLEKAYDRLNEFFKGTVDIKFNSNVYESDWEIEGYQGIFTEVQLGEYVNPIFIIEVDSKTVDKFEVKAHHKKYNVNVVTNSYDVPLDATLNVEDVKLNINLKTDKYKIENAYDIDVIKTGTGTKITKIEDGIFVYLPISGKNIGDKMKVLHIKDNTDIGEEYEGEVVELNGNKFVKFKTNHFSTYALAEETTTVSNPETSDGIIKSIIFIVIGLGAFSLLLKFKPKSL